MPKRKRMTVAEEKALRADVARLTMERRYLAMLASKTPQFDNPLVAWSIEVLRDRVLAEPPAPTEGGTGGTHNG